MTYRSITRSRPSPTTPTDIITYRYNKELVYVPVAPNYDEALTHAREAFPQLNKLRGGSLSLSLTTPGNEPKLVGISASAWPKLITHITRYQIIEVHVTREGDLGDSTIPIPNITVTDADADDALETEPVPPYHGPDVVVDEKSPYPSSRPRTLSTTTMHTGKRNWFFQRLHGH